jgi:hypothetical protein
MAPSPVVSPKRTKTARTMNALESWWYTKTGEAEVLSDLRLDPTPRTSLLLLASHRSPRGLLDTECRSAEPTRTTRGRVVQGQAQAQCTAVVQAVQTRPVFVSARRKDSSRRLHDSSKDQSGMAGPALVENHHLTDRAQAQRADGVHEPTVTSNVSRPFSAEVGAETILARMRSRVISFR